MPPNRSSMVPRWSTQSDRNEDETKAERDAADTRRSRKVMGCRLLFVAVLTLTAVVASVAVYRASKQNDEADFQQRFADFADHVLSTAQIRARTVFRSFESLSLRIAVYARASRQEWPLVIVPSFEAQFDDIRNRTGAVTMAFVPTVTEDNRDAYEDHQRKHAREWIDEAFLYSGVPANDYLFFPTIFTVDLETNAFSIPQNRGVYAPVAQTAPIQGSTMFVNFDLLSNDFIRLGYDAVHLVNDAVLSAVVNLGNVSDTDTSTWPQSSLATPVYDRPGSNDNASIVGMLTANLPWHQHFLDIIPPGIDAMDVVLDNTCGQTCTYRIEGPIVTYLGVGDLHEPRYTEYGRSAPFAPFQNRVQCNYTFHVYPTEQFQRTYVTDHPRTSTIVVACIFLFTAVFFIIYDQVVERRQDKVLRTVQKTNALVTSIFPDNVRERVLDGMHNSGSGNGNRPDARQPAPSSQCSTGTRYARQPPQRRRISVDRLLDMKWSSVETNDCDDARSQESVVDPPESSPIAESFDNVTIMFADIYGFQLWSRTATPEHVFRLLETLYRAFDRLADEIGIFKVETIGNCYVAACGLPQPCADHAERMFRFAQSCIVAASRLLRTTLHREIGGMTHRLQLRCGLHSGPVTAGVLRGSKSRFQLFGDTMNTTARIEVSGRPGRVHLSESTADELTGNGRAGWIVPRKDAVTAKGKGQLRTFWGKEGLRDAVLEGR